MLAQPATLTLAWSQEQGEVAEEPLRGFAAVAFPVPSCMLQYQPKDAMGEAAEGAE